MYLIIALKDLLLQVFKIIKTPTTSMSIVSNIIKQTFSITLLALLSIGLLSSFSQVSAFANAATGDNVNNNALLPAPGAVCDANGTGTSNTGQNTRCLVIGGQENSLPVIAGNIAQFITFIVASIAVIFIVYGAFVWMTDTDKGAEKGRKIITSAVIALIIAVLAFGLTQTIINVLNTTQVSN